MDVGMMIAKISGAALFLILIVGGLSMLAHKRRRKLSPVVVLGAGVCFVLLSLRVLFKGDAFPAPSPTALMVLTGVTWFSAAFLTLKVLDLLVIGEYLIDRHGAYIPDVVRLLMTGVGLAATGLVILQALLQINPIALVALPTVMTAIIGVALRDTLVRFFSGIALGKMIRIGDWVSVLDCEGIVTGINFSHVTLMTRAQAQVTVPNDTVVQSSVTNYSRTAVHLQSIVVEASEEVPPAIVCDVLVEATAAVEGVLNKPTPVAWVQAFKETGVQYKLWFALSDYGLVPAVESSVRTYIWNAFRRKEIQMPSPHLAVRMDTGKQTGNHETLSEDHIIAQLREVDILSLLSVKQMAELVRDARVQQFLPGERVVRQGEAGEDLYIILEGAMEVEEEVGGLTKVVNTLKKGQFFGEMSFLTGAPRSVTVICTTPVRVLVIGKEALGRAIEGNTEVIDQIGALVAARQLNSQVAREALHRERTSLDLARETRSLIARMYRFLWGRKGN